MKRPWRENLDIHVLIVCVMLSTCVVGTAVWMTWEKSPLVLSNKGVMRWVLVFAAIEGVFVLPMILTRWLDNRSDGTSFYVFVNLGLAILAGVVTGIASYWLMRS